MLWQFGGVLFLSFWVFFHKKVKKICSFLIFYLPLFLSAPCSPSTAISPYGELNKELQEKKKRNFQVFGYFIFLKDWNKVALRSEKTGHCFRSPLELLSGRGFSILKGHQDITSRGGRTDLCAWAHILHWDRSSWKLGPARAGSTRTAQVSHTQNILMCSRRNHLKQINWPWDNCGHEKKSVLMTTLIHLAEEEWGGTRSYRWPGHHKLFSLLLWLLEVWWCWVWESINTSRGILEKMAPCSWLVLF